MERIEARISRNWVVRMLVAGLAFLGFGLAAVYDGKVRYPEVNRDFRQFIAGHVGEPVEALRTEFEVDEDLGRYTGLCERWNDYWKKHRKGWLARRGWKDVDQSKLFLRQQVIPGAVGKVVLVDAIHSPWDIRTQFIMAAVCVPVGAWMLVRLLLAWPRRLAADGDNLYTTDGRTVPITAITDIDKRKWDRKAIAIVHFQLNGRAGKAIIDDWIFAGAAAVLERLESVRQPPAAPAAANEPSAGA